MERYPTYNIQIYKYYILNPQYGGDMGLTSPLCIGGSEWE